MQNVKNKSAQTAKSDIETPLHLSQYLTDLVLSVMTPKVILDPCAGNDNLTRYYRNVEVIRYEIKEGRDFFESNNIQCDLVVCNPPFNGAEGRKLFPEEFLRHIVIVTPPHTPIVFITPHGFRHNVRDTSARLAFLKTLNITSVITLPVNVFDGVLFHTEVLIFNLPRLKSHYTYSPYDPVGLPPVNLKSVFYKLQTCIDIHPSLVNVCQILAQVHGLQQMAGSVLAALVFHTDNSGFVSMNRIVRETIAQHIGRAAQVVTNQLKALCDMNLLTRVSRGMYGYEALSAEDCRKIKEGQFSNVSIELSYLQTQLLPAFHITVE